jgi:hypothetical protein
MNVNRLFDLNYLKYFENITKKTTKKRNKIFNNALFLFFLLIKIKRV